MLQLTNATSAFIFIGLVAAASLSSCGVKGPPLPPVSTSAELSEPVASPTPVTPAAEKRR